jgi:RecJ-like exonuclease
VFRQAGSVILTAEPLSDKRLGRARFLQRLPCATCSKTSLQSVDRSATRTIMSIHPEHDLNPGDDAEPGTPGTGEDVCDACAGKGTLPDGKACPQCGGSGHVTVGIGGG